MPSLRTTLSRMRAAIVLSALLGSAAQDPAFAALRGSRSLPEAAGNATQQQAKLPGPDGELLVGNVSGDLSHELTNLPTNGSAPVPILLSSGGWSQGGDKMWGSGTGIESINSGNVGYYDQGMSAARSHCGGAGCALMVNPPGHRTINQFHIHFAHYQGYGQSLKKRVEGKVCGKSGWHSGGLPCGGKAAFFSGFPGIFSKAMTAGSIRHASVIAWPESCGGSGTIVELAYGCSIEHQIRGDFDPSKR